jgi:2'-hydroxyisoflavone reductase
MAEGGEVLAPEGPAVARTQVIDARDLARWIVASASAGRVGTFNAVAEPVPLAAVLEAAPGEADVVWVPWEFLEAHGVQPWTDLPAWVPAPMQAMLLADGSKAAAAGLELRSIKATVADLAAWDRERPQVPLRAGMTREREAELLRVFRAEGRPPGP